MLKIFPKGTKKLPFIKGYAKSFLYLCTQIIYIGMAKALKSVAIVFAAVAICYAAGYGCGRALKSMLRKSIEYPATAREGVVDNYFGTEVADPYRWLEDDNSEATAQWVAAQNKVTFDYLHSLPAREKIKSRLSSCGTTLHRAHHPSTASGTTSRATADCRIRA